VATVAPVALNVGFGTPFQAQIDFLRSKLALPTERWDDIQRSAHDRAFIVAGAAKADLLADLQASLVEATTTGKGLEAWRKDFKTIVARHGWTGWTGEGTPGGEAWRTKVIYQTNLSTSYAAGRYKQMTDPEYLKVRPFWRYLHSDSVLHPRPLHLAWHGLTLPNEHPFWKEHFPPNGWGCQCRVTTVSKKEGLASQRAGLGEPPAGWDKIDPKTGAPVGIDKGFDYMPGATWHPNLDKYPHEVARQIVADNMKDGVFARWHQRIADRTSTALAGPDYASLGKAEQIEKARRDLGGIESYPVAVLPPNAVESMGLQTQVVLVSEYDLVKQQVSRVGQNFDALDYLQAQITLDNPRLVVRENNQMTLWVSDAAGKWYAAVLQQTATGKGVFLKSFRRSSAGDALAQRKKGEVLLDQLAKE
jgi:hypothetical protein